MLFLNFSKIKFKNSYNTVLHSKLYERLKKVLKKGEIELIRAIYSRIRIRLGKHEFSPNIGVAQGSVISPALFNIYCEDLYIQLMEKADVALEDLLGYADDLLVLCTSLAQLRLVIKVLKDGASIIIQN